MSIYNFEVKKPCGLVLSMKHFVNKTMLIVNTANHCGLTYQFEDLQKLYNKYKNEQFIVLAFPCNQFDNQNPEDAKETESICKSKYGVTFPLLEVVDVNGDDANPLFTYLKQKGECRDFGQNVQELQIKDYLLEKNPSYLQGNNIRWNFTKFLVDRQGNVVKRFEPTDSLLDVEEAIEQLL